MSNCKPQVNKQKEVFVRLLLILHFVLLAGVASAKERTIINGANKKDVKIYRVKKDSTGAVIQRTPISTMEEIEMLPSWKICHSPPLSSTDTFEIRECVGCEVTFNISKGTTYSTGHESSHSGTHPVGSIVGKTLGVTYTIGTTPYFFDYEAPDVAVEALITVDIMHPNHPPLPPTYQTWNITALAYVPGLIDQSGVSYITFNNITSHPGNGTYMTYAAGNFLVDALINYNNIASTNGVPTGSIVTPNSEAASLQYGGLFDIGKNFSNPHCTHRDGKNIDIGMSAFASSPYKTTLLDALEQGFLMSGFDFPVSYESPDDPTSTHWHAEYQ